MTTIITGASSGLGKAIFQAMEGKKELINWSLDTGVDVSRLASVEAAVEKLKGLPIQTLINCAGINHIEWFPATQVEDFDLLMDTNARSIFLTTRALLPNLQGGTILNIVSNAAHIPMTNSLAYNASKAAALMMTKQMARELKKTHDITVFSVSPNKLKGTGMSAYIDGRVPALRGWTPQQAEAYQLQAMPAGEETDPATLAEFIAFLLSSKQRHKFLNGADIPYGI